MYETYETVAVNAEEKKGWLDRLGDIWAVTYTVMHFIPLLNTPAFILYLVAGENETLMYFLAPIMLLGMACTLITHPIAIPWSMIKRIARAFWGPLVNVPVIPLNLVASAVAGGIMATVCLGALIAAPGALTMYYFFSEE